MGIFSEEVEDALRKDWDVEGAPERRDRLAALIGALATPPAHTVVRVNTLRCDAAAAAALLQAEIDKQYPQAAPPVARPHPTLPDVVVVPCVGPRDDLARHRRAVVVGNGCGVAVLRGADVYAPGVLAAPPYMRAGDDVSVYADLDGACRRGLTRPYAGATYFVGNGVAAVSRADIFGAGAAARGLAVRMGEPLYATPSLNGVLPGVVFPQNLPSVVCARVLAPEPGQTVLDMCAAPGGKTTHVAALMRDRGRVVALDKTGSKVARVIANAERLGLTCIEAYACDARRAVADDPGGAAVADDVGGVAVADDPGGAAVGPPPYAAESFDRVLLDAPCSALGQRPQLRATATPAELRGFPRLQGALLAAAARLLRVGGFLVYATCTVTVGENEARVAAALERLPCLRLSEQTPRVAGAGLPGVGLTEEQRHLVQRFDPGAGGDDCDGDTIGFFIAKFEKVSEFR